jgi:hypothetical protein
VLDALLLTCAIELQNRTVFVDWESKGMAGATNTLHVSGQQCFFFVAIFFGSGDHPSVLNFEGWVNLCYWPLPTKARILCLDSL